MAGGAERWRREQRRLDAAGPPSFSVSVKVDKRKLKAIIKNLGANVEKALMLLAVAAEAEAKINAPVDTGALRNSIFAKKLNKDTAMVGVGVDYAAYLEFGTHRQAAQPYLLPAVYKVLRDSALIKKLFKNVATDGD
jgi:HK97 gp10 family phage protein